ncbi:MAG: AI-2E family transporter [Actinomycetia bacterium]|nr:AI-2E family transporter [Actinomycetes bacterium]
MQPQRRRIMHPDTPAWIPSAVALAVGAWFGTSILLGLLDSLSTLIMVLVGSMLVAFALDPAVSRLERAGMRRGAATFLLMAGIVVAFSSTVIAVGALVSDQLSELAADAPGTLRELVVFLNRNFSTSFDADSVVDQVFRSGGPIDALRERIVEDGLQWLSSASAILPGFLLTFYLAADLPRMRRFVCSLVAPERQGEVRRAFDLGVEKTSAYVGYRLILTVIGTAFMAVTMVVVGVPFWAAATLWFALTNMWVPIVGGALSIALPVGLAATASPGTAVAMLAVAVVYQNVVKNVFLAPKLAARAVKLHPAVGFTAVLVALILLGPAAALMATPVTATLQAFLGSYLRRHEVSD